jgi:adenosylhomocysteine nucleosidase
MKEGIRMEKSIGIIGAMDEEIELCRKNMSDVKEFAQAGITYFQGRLHGKTVILCKSGVGKVNASICTQILVDHFSVDHVIFTGVAGGVDPDLNIGDIVISEDCRQHDIDASPLGFKRGEIPFATTSVFPAHSDLIQLAYKSGAKLKDVKTVIGRILSGDQFVADKEQVQDLFDEFKGSCVEMEGAAVAQVCHLNQIPFVIIRSLSDKADGSAHVNFLEFTKLAAERSYFIVDRMVEEM